MEFLEILDGSKKDPSVQDLIAAFLELEGKQDDLQTAFDECYNQTIRLQTRSLAGQGDSRELKAAQARLDDFQQKFEAIRSGQETIKEKLANRILADARHRLINEIPSAISTISEERRGLWREFLETYSRAAVLYARIRGGAGQIPRINFEFGGLGDNDRSLYIELITKEKSEGEQKPSCDSRIDTLSREAARLERMIDEFDPSAAVAEVLKAAGSKAYQLPPEPEAEPEYVPKSHMREEWAPEPSPDPWAGEEGKAVKQAYYGGRGYEEERAAQYEKLLSEPEPGQDLQEANQD